MELTLSNRQAKTADRVGGATLMLPWPASLPIGQVPRPDHEREATAAERAAAEALVRPLCDLHGLVPVHTRVVMVRHPDETDYQQRLAVLLIGQRWVHASTRAVPPDIWPA
jgi:hypothetical protein